MSLSGGPVEGRAVDADTGKPVTNAVAYGIWDGVLTSLTRTDGNCIWAESARLDSQGKFRLPAWRTWGVDSLMTSHIQQSVFVYAPGYKLKVLSARDPPEIALTRFVGTTDDRFQELNISPCVPTGAEHRLAIVYRMMADEEERLAGNDDRYVWSVKEARAHARAARTDPSKPTTRDDEGYTVNVDPNDQYPE
jgi:hypothetical protein